MSILELPLGTQLSRHDCGVRCLQTMMAYYGVEVPYYKLARNINSNQRIGTSISSIIRVAKRNKLEPEANYNMSLAEVKGLIDVNYLILTMVQAWANKKLSIDEWKKDQNYGHWVIINGYIRDRIIFYDPMCFNLAWLYKDEFLARWYSYDDSNNKISNFGIIFTGKEPAKREMEHMD